MKNLPNICNPCIYSWITKGFNSNSTELQGSEQLLPGYLKCCQNFNTDVTESCNTAIERKFCELSEYVKY